MTSTFSKPGRDSLNNAVFQRRPVNGVSLLAITTLFVASSILPLYGVVIHQQGVIKDVASRQKECSVILSYHDTARSPAARNQTCCDIQNLRYSFDRLLNNFRGDHNVSAAIKSLLR
jgi:hypothetical protein